MHNGDKAIFVHFPHNLPHVHLYPLHAFCIECLKNRSIQFLEEYKSNINYDDKKHFVKEKIMSSVLCVT